MGLHRFPRAPAPSQVQLAKLTWPVVHAAKVRGWPGTLGMWERQKGGAAQLLQFSFSLPTGFEGLGKEET